MSYYSAISHKIVSFSKAFRSVEFFFTKVNVKDTLFWQEIWFSFQHLPGVHQVPLAPIQANLLLFKTSVYKCMQVVYIYMACTESYKYTQIKRKKNG